MKRILLFSSILLIVSCLGCNCRDFDLTKSEEQRNAGKFKVTADGVDYYGNGYEVLRSNIRGGGGGLIGSGGSVASISIGDNSKITIRIFDSACIQNQYHIITEFICTNYHIVRMR